MRLRLDFAEHLVSAPLRKSWISVPAHFHLLSDLYTYIVKSFSLSVPEDRLRLTLEDHYLPGNQRLFDIIKDSDLILVSEAEKLQGTGERQVEVKTPSVPQRARPVPALKRKESSDSSDSSLPAIPQKRPNSSAKDPENRKNPRLAQFQGTHIKFDSEGASHVVQGKPVLDLKLKPPAQEFDERKAGWKTKPFPKRKPEQQVKIKEKYEYDEKEFEPGEASGLTAGQEVLFKTLELSDAMVPVVSDFKVRSMQRAKVNWVNESQVNVSLLREVGSEERAMIENAEVIDDSVVEKYYLTVEKAKMGDLRVKKTS